MITNYTVTGMTCGHCVAHVTEEVSAIPGVTDVKVLQAGPMTVTSDSAIDFDAVSQAVQEAGDYQVALA
ncbi:heavy-metal-associated domain-containing protein [Brooklawnia cerclae]|uniref:Copper chaperone CopZ n=1 Tax=Brooklawnia cerclae TaxID=349934 RepID=A0ABX0SN63_9ACTN|nr:cation transporter [Brooklawnia cerclae]NIH58211.1 copper chaperone CopZ [Brooklawnia cerclae]